MVLRKRRPGASGQGGGPRPPHGRQWRVPQGRGNLAVGARTDALTSLVVVAAGVGALFGLRWADPVAGLVVAGFILLMLARSAVRVFARMLDAVDPGLVGLARSVVEAVDGVRGVGDLRLRWHGHELQVVALAAVDPLLTVEQGHGITQQVEHDLMHAFPYSIHAVPADKKRTPEGEVAAG